MDLHTSKRFQLVYLVQYKEGENISKGYFGLDSNLYYIHKNQNSKLYFKGINKY